MRWNIPGVQEELNDVIDRSIIGGPQTIVRDGNDDTSDLRDFLLSRSDLFSDEFAVITERIVRERADNYPRDVDL